MYKALRNGVQIVAVKLFKEEMTRGAINSLTSPKHAEQFRREISILKSCHDKNIVQFLGAVLAVRPNQNLPDACSAIQKTFLHTSERLAEMASSMLKSGLPLFPMHCCCCTPGLMDCIQ